MTRSNQTLHHVLTPVCRHVPFAADCVFLGQDFADLVDVVALLFDLHFDSLRSGFAVTLLMTAPIRQE